MTNPIHTIQVAIRFNSLDIYTGDYGIVVEPLAAFTDISEAYDYCEEELRVFPAPTKDFNIERTNSGVIVGKCPLPNNPLYNKAYRAGELLIIDTKATVRSVLETRLMVMEQTELVQLVIDLVEGKGVNERTNRQEGDASSIL